MERKSCRCMKCGKRMFESRKEDTGLMGCLEGIKDPDDVGRRVGDFVDAEKERMLQRVLDALDRSPAFIRAEKEWIRKGLADSKSEWEEDLASDILDSDSNVKIDLKHTPMELASFYCETASIAFDIVEACGFDPTSSKVKEVDDMLKASLGRNCWTDVKGIEMALAELKERVEGPYRPVLNPEDIPEEPNYDRYEELRDNLRYYYDD